MKKEHTIKLLTELNERLEILRLALSDDNLEVYADDLEETINLLTVIIFEINNDLKGK